MGVRVIISPLSRSVNLSGGPRGALVYIFFHSLSVSPLLFFSYSYVLPHFKDQYYTFFFVWYCLESSSKLSFLLSFLGVSYFSALPAIVPSFAVFPLLLFFSFSPPSAHPFPALPFIPQSLCSAFFTSSEPEFNTLSSVFNRFYIFVSFGV